MGNCCRCCCCKPTPIIKEGLLYTNIMDQIRPLDLVLFKGNSIVSRAICEMEKRGNKLSEGGDFSHVGIIVTSDVLAEPLLQHGKLYVLESTMSGKLGAGVNNIYGRTFLGVQIREFEPLINHYDDPNETAIGWGKLINNPIDNEDIELVKKRLTPIYNEINGLMWDANCWSSLSAMYPCMRPCRPCAECTIHTEDWLLCSEMVAYVYKKMDILPEYVNPKDVVPADFIVPNEDNDKMPKIVEDIVHITIPKHYMDDLS